MLTFGTVTSIVVIVAFGGWIAWHIALDARHRRKLSAAVARVEAEDYRMLRDALRSWEGSTYNPTEDSADVLAWSGRDAELVHIELLDTQRPSWTVWARTPTGKFFKVTFQLDDALAHMKAGSNFADLTKEQMVQALLPLKGRGFLAEIGVPVVQA